MRAVVQRADGASVSVGGEIVGSFEGPGLVILVAVTHDDDAASARRLAEKAYGLRIFEPRHGARVASDARELSASDLGLPLLVISQFTLYGDTRKGRRPTWDAAAPRAVAEPLVDQVVASLRDLGAQVHTGRFGADMAVRLTNDGPFTILLET
ncbi:MAG: D-tyrosyl-tRNA(Tyr) deacylase [Actinomycetales bacterium]|nr:D-tyrosyl-tRNA(Tyr) deacylase [Actinomycetales bacterium]